jgi:hypothetical protein
MMKGGKKCFSKSVGGVWSAAGGRCTRVVRVDARGILRAAPILSKNCFGMRSILFSVARVGPCHSPTEMDTKKYKGRQRGEPPLDTCKGSPYPRSFKKKEDWVRPAGRAAGSPKPHARSTANNNEPTTLHAGKGKVRHHCLSSPPDRLVNEQTFGTEQSGMTTTTFDLGRNVS